MMAIPVLNLADLNGNNGLKIPGNNFNGTVSTGDINGDGYSDLVIGSTAANESKGKVYVIFGQENGFDATFDLTNLDGNNGLTIANSSSSDYGSLGYAVSNAGDINGDGFSDLVISGKYSEEAYVIFGTNNGFDANFDLASLNGDNGFTIPNISGIFHVSSAVSHAGDINNDGFDDLAISSLDTEEAYVIFGTNNGFDATFDLSTLDGNNGFTIPDIDNDNNFGAGIDRDNRLGDAISNAGDLNGDGFDDLIIGAPWSAETTDEYYGWGRGKAYVILGTDKGFDAKLDLASLDGSNGFTITGIDIDDNLGDAVSNGGDLNGDGFNDLIISAPSAEETIEIPDGYTDSEIQGEIYVILGTNNGFDANFDLTNLDGNNGFAIRNIDKSDGFDESFGKIVDSAGDINGDGFNDLVISASEHGDLVAYVVFGSQDLGQSNTIEETPSLSNPVVTVLDDEDDGDLSAGDISLREAILYSESGDKIRFDTSLRDGTILLTLGELSIDKSLTIQGFDASQLTIDANDNSRVFNVDNKFSHISDVTIEHLTITGGNAGDRDGGGIKNEENLTINNSIITGNSAGYGGGVSSFGGVSTITINNSIVSNNSAELGGGGIYNTSNTSGIGSDNSLNLNDSIITGNFTHGFGGGIENDFGRININNSNIERNEAEQSGGGISSYGTVEIVNSTISDNQATSGAGIDIDGFDSDSIIVNSTISGNTATTLGGGIYKDAFYGINTVTNSTITGNAAPDGAGIYQNPYSSEITITSSIIAGNINNNDAEGAGLASGGNNLIGNGDDAPGFVNRINGDIVGTAAEPIDPQLGPLQDNGGLTFTHALLPESIAINTGSNPEELTTDQRGEGFARTLFDTPDIGAFEADTDSVHDLPIPPLEPMVKIVTTLDDEDDGDLSAEDLSLREAILSSNSGDTIAFDSDLSGGIITLTLGELVVNKNLTIQGLGANNLTIDGNNSSRVFNISDGSSTRIDVTIEQLTISGGNAADSSGGGINNQENLIVNDAIISGNLAEWGGGISTDDFAATTINNTTISNNVADNSGGGVSNSSASTIINNSTISGNSASNYHGGGIDSVSFYGGSTIVNNSTISGNSANRNGGGINGFDSSVHINNSTISGNSANDSGSGIYFGAYGTVTSSIIAGNANDEDLEIAGNVTSGGNNLIGNGEGTDVFHNGINSDLVGTAANPIAPRLGELQDNGGRTFTHALLADSPAINAGSNPEELTTDQRGEGFARTLFDATDIGAFEADTDSVHSPRTLPPDPIVTILDDEDDGDLSAEDVSLREAILYSDSGDTISFDASLNLGTITLSLGELIVAKDLIIQGLGADNLTIDANNNSRVLRVDDKTDDSIDVTLDGVTITGGYTNQYASNFYHRFGGGIFNEENLIITNSIISNNVSYGGGGIYNRGTIEIDSSTVSDNSAESDPVGNAEGGGIWNSERVSDGSITMKISNSTISGNTAQGDGGGISNSGGYYDNPSQTIITNSTISGNTAQGNGGGVSSFARYTQIQNSTISNNSASSLGSGIYHERRPHDNNFGSTVLSSSIVAENAGERDLTGSLIISDGHNLIGNGNDTDNFSHGVNGDLVGTAANPIAPQLDFLKDNGGRTFTHALLAESPAINAGSHHEDLTTDQRGFNRSVEQTDIGAFEVQTEQICLPSNSSDDLSDCATDDNDTLFGAKGNDVLSGSAGNDKLRGGDGNDILNGGFGNDTLNGGQQFDHLNGEDGDDVLIGNSGTDVLTGGVGLDLFYFENVEGRDWILDFKLGIDQMVLTDGMTHDALEITGKHNSFISYQGNQVAVLLGIAPNELSAGNFRSIAE